MDILDEGDGLMSAGPAPLGVGHHSSSYFDIPGVSDESTTAADEFRLPTEDDDISLMAALESGGALLNAEHWSISTSSSGSDRVQWSGGKLFDPWAPVQQQGVLGSAAARAPQSKSTAMGFLGIKAEPGLVKPDPDEGWVPASSSVTCNGASNRDYPPLSVLGGQPGGDFSNRTSSEPAHGMAVSQRPAQAASTGPSRQLPTRAATAAAASPVVKAEPQQQDEDEEDDEEEDDEGDRDSDAGGDSGEPVSELSEKRRRNREHAKRSRMRKRVRLGGLEEMVLELRRENVRLRQIVKQGIPDRAEDIIRTCASDNTDADLVAKQDVVQGMRPGMTVGRSSSWGNKSSRYTSSGGSRSRPKVKLEGGGGGKGGSSSSSGRHAGGGSGRNHRVPSALKLMSPCYQSVKALSESQANFILTNPNLPGCPIIFASPGFLELTGYEAGQVIGKNCRFLQGPGTDPMTASIIRNNLSQGRDTSVCILNYKADGTPFWNQLSIGNLLDAHGRVANNVGVLCEVNQMPPADFHRLLHRVPLPESLLHDTSSDSGSDVLDSKSKLGRCMQSATRHTSSNSVKSSSAPANPRVVDRLRRTRAASAAD